MSIKGREWFDEVLGGGNGRLGRGGDGAAAAAGGGEGWGDKPNPSLAGTSRFPHSVLWLESELEILTWWETVRETIRVPIAMNPHDSALLHYEKELLEWWHNVRGDYGFQ